MNEERKTPMDTWEFGKVHHEFWHEKPLPKAIDPVRTVKPKKQKK